MSTFSTVHTAGTYQPPRGIVAGLFDGIALSVEQQFSAQKIVADAIDAQLTVTLRNADGWARLLEVHAMRDRALRALLATEADREMFDQHATQLRHRQTELRPPVANAPIVFRATVVPYLGGMLEIVFRADGMSDESIATASTQVVHAFRTDAEQLGLPKMSAIADVLERRDEFATYSRSIKRTYGRQVDGAWMLLPAA